METLKKFWAFAESCLVDGWRQAWRWFSMQAMAAAGLLLTVWATIPEDLKAVMPPAWTKGIAIALIVLGLAGRIVKQPGTQK